MPIISLVVGLLVFALVCLVMLGHRIERKRQEDIELSRLVRQRRSQPSVPVDLDSILEPSKLTAREINEGFAKVRREREARSAPYPTPSRNQRYDNTEPVNPLHIAGQYPTPSRSYDCAVIGLDMAEAADRTVVHHCSAPSSYSLGGSDSYGGSSDGGYSSSSCDSSSSSSGCD
ncbi:MAG: hypothetical protein ACRC02_07005 [Vogesella sp.]|uniref:hypothetical protein n=1 Tax=Vogesella sp. TaxID=1904252 RepID=UPI003F3CECDA